MMIFQSTVLTPCGGSILGVVCVCMSLNFLEKVGRVLNLWIVLQNTYNFSSVMYRINNFRTQPKSECLCLVLTLEHTIGNSWIIRSKQTGSLT